MSLVGAKEAAILRVASVLAFSNRMTASKPMAYCQASHSARPRASLRTTATTAFRWGPEFTPVYRWVIGLLTLAVSGGGNNPLAAPLAQRAHLGHQQP